MSFTLTALLIATIGFAIGRHGDLFRTLSPVLPVLLDLALVSLAFQVWLGVVMDGLSSTGDRLIRRLVFALRGPDNSSSASCSA